MIDDGDRTPMTRTELGMLWDLLGRWFHSTGHPGLPHHVATEGAVAIRSLIDAELAERFGQ
jgi:hypothetical protein